MPPIKIPYKRPSGIKSPSLIVIATEGHETEPQYFKGLKEFFKNSKVHINILERTDPSLSAPNHVLNQLIEFKKKYKLHKNDSLWMVIDVDRWARSLPEVANECFSRKIDLAVSNPAFEIWLLLHHKDINEYSEEELNSFNGDTLKTELRQLLGSYNSSNLNMDDFLRYIDVAISRAKGLELNVTNRWPQTIGTRVYKLVEKITQI